MKLAILTNKPYESCETFIKAQIDGLSNNLIYHYWGQPFPFISKRNYTLWYRILIKCFPKLRNTKNQLLFQLKKDKVEIVLAQYGMVGSEVVGVCKQLDLPLVVHFHGHDAVRNSILEGYKDKYARMFAYNNLRVISVSHVMTERLVNFGCSRKKIVYNPYGPNDAFLQIEPKFDKLQCIAIGRFVPKKAPELTIKAFALALKEYPKATLVMAGDGELLEKCKNLVSTLGITSQVTFPGIISPEKFREYLKESRVFVQHSVTAADGDMEGTPVAILEAQAAGLPVVATIHAGIPDVVLHNETGYLVEELDVNLMAHYIMMILENRSKAIQMGIKGKERIEQYFTMTRYLETLQKVLTVSK